MSSDEPLPVIDAELASLDRVIGAQYEIIRPLGRGGMGAVYLARERLLDRLVAIKVLRSEHVGGEARERFLREARTAAKLTHPNIVPLYSFGQSGDTVFYVMGYVDGESLEAHLRRAGRMAPQEASRILGALADALDYAHRNGIVHRDIKPDNVLLERGTGRAVLTDFGIAKLESIGGGLTETGVIVGTPHYMSPEQGAGDRTLDGRSDVYSLGVLGYRMISGRLPFEAASLHELLAQHATRLPPPLTSIVVDLDPGLSSTIARCLEKDPVYRWPSAAALAASLSTSTDATSSMPDGLEHLPGHAVRFAMGLGVMELITLGMYGGTGKIDWLALSVVEVALYGLALTPTFFVAAARGIRPRRAFHLMMAPPGWWSGWWPHRFRRPGDVWDRLPYEARRFRTIDGVATLVMFGVALPVLVPVVIHGLANPEIAPALRVLKIAAGVWLVPLFAIIPAGLRFRKWLAKTGLPKGAREKLIGEPTWNSRFWSRPDIAPLLAPAVDVPVAETAPKGLAALLAEIDAAVADLARIDPRLAADVRSTAHEAGVMITQLEREIDNLAAHVDSEEVERMLARIDELGGRDDPAIRQMRQLITDQLALMRGLQERQRALEERHAHALARLHTMWLQLRSLRAQRVLESAEAAEITGRIRALCADVGHLNAAIDEVNALTKG